MKRLIKKSDLNFPTLEELISYVKKYGDETKFTQYCEGKLEDFVSDKIQNFDDIEKIQNYDESDAIQDFTDKINNDIDLAWDICEKMLELMLNNAPDDVCESIKKCYDNAYPEQNVKNFAVEIMAMHNIDVNVTDIKETEIESREPDGIEEEYWQDRM